MDFNSGIDHMNQVVSYERLVYFGYIFEKSGLLSQSGKNNPLNKPQLVFGQRAVLHTESPNKIRQAGYIEMLQIQKEESKQQNMYVNPYMEQEPVQQQQNSRFFTPKKDDTSSKFGSKINLISSNQSKSRLPKSLLPVSNSVSALGRANQQPESITPLRIEHSYA